MNAKAASFAFFVLTLAVYQAHTAEPEARRLPLLEFIQDVGGKAQPKPSDKDKKTPDKKLTEPPVTDIFAQAPIMGRQFATGFNPNMMGDFGSFFARQIITIPGVQTTTTRTTTQVGNNGQPQIITRTNTVTTPTFQTRTILVPIASLGSFKVAENASPRPQDRVFFTYNYFNGLGNWQGAIDPVNVTQSNTLVGRAGSTNTSINTFIPGTPRASAELHREVFGFEKTFFNGTASIELRLPLFQQNGNFNSFQANEIGDLTVIGKYAFLLDPATGNVVSGGLAVTAPTGSGILTTEGEIHSTRIQPWGGYIWNFDRFFFHGFHSVVIPTDARDITLLFNDIGLNFWLYRGDSNGFLNFIVPMIEAHATTPLNHRDQSGAIVVPDTVVLTGGVHLGVFRNATLSLGAATPITGPCPFNIEGFVQLNWRF